RGYPKRRTKTLLGLVEYNAVIFEARRHDQSSYLLSVLKIDLGHFAAASRDIYQGWRKFGINIRDFFDKCTGGHISSFFRRHYARTSLHFTTSSVYRWAPGYGSAA